ncbi:MAG TPA: 50S ribosomal protein L18 [Bacteroidota bacterium]|nr:50S ribosomal protein L18 [Bacteroidota bacterium]
MSIRKVKKYTTREKRKIRIRKKVLGTPECPRLTVYRSLKHMYAQLFDDSRGVSLGTISTKTENLAGDLAAAKGKVEAARIVGKGIAELAKSKNITSVVFDRNGYLYHGRVKAVADGAREAGLEF